MIGKTRTEFRETDSFVSVCVEILCGVRADGSVAIKELPPKRHALIRMVYGL